MAVQPQTPYKEFIANGSTTVIPLEFDCENKDHLIVMIDDSEVDDSSWTLNNNQVVFNTAPATNKKITLQRNTPYRRDRHYQAYDNSFRPGPVNADFDWIWWKLQELGVADWLLKNYVDRLHQQQENKINDLKTYVDDRDDELRAYLIEEIRKQGVALDQLDDYYNYLMQRLAQIAVDKGWDASFVVTASGKTQQEVNDQGLSYWRDIPALGYRINSLVMLENGDIVRSTVDNNIVNPNLEMVGWINIGSKIKTLYDFGATGVGDDAPALQRALDHGCFAITGTHKILSKVYVNNDVYMLGLGGTLKPSVARGVVNFQVSTDIFLMNNVQVDGVNYKGNRNDEHGMYFINAGPDARPKTLVLKANSLKNIYGDGFRTYCDNCDVTGNTLINVAGLNLTTHASGAYDNYGDGIHIMGAKSGVVACNYIVNDETTIVDLGRGGIVLEFGVENVSVYGNTIRGYDRGIHAETVLAPLIENNNIDLCGTTVLLSDAPQTVIRNNILLSTVPKTTGLFGSYATLYDYNGNSAVIEGNTITATLGKKAILSNGVTKRKFTKINKNRINGDVLITAGAVGAEFSGNIIGETLTSVINITGKSITDKNTVHNDSYMTLAAPSGSVSSNTFESPSVVPLRITNPTNLTVNDNVFNLTASYASTYTIDCSAAATALLGECSGNIINSDISVGMFRYASVSATHQPFICNRPNLLKTSANKISALKFLAPNNFGQRSLTYFSNVSTEPNDGRYYDQGGRVELSAPPATGATGYLVVTSGYAAANAWAATTAYAVGAFVYSGNKSYKCTVAGISGSAAPTHTGGFATDGTVTWEYLGTKAVFRALG